VNAKHSSQAHQQLSLQSHLSDSGIWDLGQDSAEDIESLLEGLPMPRSTNASISDCFDAIPDAKSGLVTVTSSQRLIETHNQLPEELNQTEQKSNRLPDSVKSINIRLLALEQTQAELAVKMTEQQRHFKQLFDWVQNEKETENNKIKQVDYMERSRLTSEAVGHAEENMTYMSFTSEIAPTCFLLEFYPRPGNGYSGRIHHTLSNQVACFKGLNLEQILPFIKKYLPHPEESNPVNQQIVRAPEPELPFKPAEQFTAIIERQPSQISEHECSCIKEFGLIQDSQKTTQPPFCLQARKRFAVMLNLELPIVQQDVLKSNYMLRYDVVIKAINILNNSIACQLLQHCGVNSKFPKDARAFYLDAMVPGNYMLDIRIMVPQKDISEQMQLEIKVV
jgi:hypothetical protein